MTVNLQSLLSSKFSSTAPVEDVVPAAPSIIDDAQSFDQISALIFNLGKISPFESIEIALEPLKQARKSDFIQEVHWAAIEAIDFKKAFSDMSNRSRNKPGHQEFLSTLFTKSISLPKIGVYF